MKLFYAPGACSLAPHIVLRELGLPFTLDRVDLRTRRTASDLDFTAINPKGYVPALQLDDGQLLTEGPAITQYLVDHFAPGSLAPPSGTVERAQVNSHLTYIGTELHKPFGPLFDPAATQRARDHAIEVLNLHFALIERMLCDGRPYLTGADFTLADAYLFAVQRWGPVTGFDLSPFPCLQAFARRVSERPAVTTALEAEARDVG